MFGCEQIYAVSITIRIVVCIEVGFTNSVTFFYALEHLNHKCT